MNDKQKVVSVGGPIIFENKTDASFEVSTGIVFRKSGVYEVSIVGNKTIVSKVEGRKKGKWIDNTYCSECGFVNEVESGFIGPVNSFNFCPNCGADMRGMEND